MKWKSGLYVLALVAAAPSTTRSEATAELCRHRGRSCVHVGRDVKIDSEKVRSDAALVLKTACTEALTGLRLVPNLDQEIAADPFAEVHSVQRQEGAKNDASAITAKVTFTPIPPPDALPVLPIKGQKGVYYIPASGILVAEVEATETLSRTSANGDTQEPIVPPLVEILPGTDSKGKTYDFMFRIYSSYSWTLRETDQVDTGLGAMHIRDFMRGIMDTPQFRDALTGSLVLVVLGTASQEMAADQGLSEYNRAADRAFVLQRELQHLINDPPRALPLSTFMLNLGRYRGTTPQVADKARPGTSTMAQRPVAMMLLLRSDDENYSDADLHDAILDALKGHMLDPGKYEGNPAKAGEFELERIDSGVTYRKPGKNRKK